VKALIIIAAILAVAAAAGFSFYRSVFAGPVQHPEKAVPGSLWDFTTETLEGEPAELAKYRGKVALVVNVASKCGLTPQYEGLETLYEKLQGREFVILGFPSNDFRKQEPGTPEQIRAFCDKNYGVSFPLFAKRKVTGEEKDAIYKFLTAGGLQEPTWNFTKYLVGRDGKVIARFAPRTTPDDKDLLAAIETALQTSLPVSD